MFRHLVSTALLLALGWPLFAQGFTTDEAVKRMKLPPGFSVRCVASEPMIRQPLSISFDSRGRLWVLQYLQYPNPAGLKPVKQDQYLRTQWDKVPEAPPKGPKGLDRITICSDPDENGVFRQSKDFVSGLNLASGFCLGNRGVYVVQPPYLLYYPDKNEDDVPDGDPEVLLSGFGLDDTHSLANSLQWGPDGWLYGAAGSTSTCRIKDPSGQAKEPIEFQQGIWRYHPKTKQFELFSEGGGNTYGLDFDRHGNAIAGTNWGGFAMLHQMQGAYYVKGFSKHGPLHNPYAYGYFDHVPYKNFQGGHVTCGGILYDADVYPEEYRHQYIAGNLLSNAVYWHKMTPKGASFTAEHGGELLEANDTWFRPVDLTLGPDGCVYVADWYDKRAAHLDPIDNWDKTNGRVYKIEYKGAKKLEPFDLRKKTSAQLLELLEHPNVWWRREARRLLADRADRVKHYDELKRQIHIPPERVDPSEIGALDRKPKPKTEREFQREQLALESLWALHACGGFAALPADRGRDQSLNWALRQNPSEYVRAWAIRLSADRGALWTPDPEKMTPVVHAQLLCSLKRLPWNPSNVQWLYPRNGIDAEFDLLRWWAVEPHVVKSRLSVTQSSGGRPGPPVWSPHPNVVRRLLEPDVPDGIKLVAKLAQPEQIQMFDPRSPGLVLPDFALDELLRVAKTGRWKTAPKEIQPLIKHEIPVEYGGGPMTIEQLDADRPPRGMKLPFSSNTPEPPDYDSRTQWKKRMEVSARLGEKASVEAYRFALTNAKCAAPLRQEALLLLADLKDEPARAVLLRWLADPKDSPFQSGVLLIAAGKYDAPPVADAILSAAVKWPAADRQKAIPVLLSRPEWALALFQAHANGKFPKADLTVDHARAAVGLNDPELTKLVEKQFGKIAAATPGEKKARIDALNLMMNREKHGDAAKGKVVFEKSCAACHQLFGEGGKVGPDLTSADRKNRYALLTHIVDPSGYIRPEYVTHVVNTLDGRTHSGVVTAQSAEAITLANYVNNKVETTTVSRKEIDKLDASSVSLMPEKLLDTMNEEEIRDLVAYLMQDPPKAPGQPFVGTEKKKLKVALISGSLEYKSDDTLPVFQKLLEDKYPIECVRMFRKTDTDVPGLDKLAECDLAIFFTRRLKIDGEQLKAVKAYCESGKPVIGIRTASHGFQNWLEMDKEVFGGNYKGHFGAGPKCETKITTAGKDHPILKDVKPFASEGSLYKNPDLPKDVTVLLTGTAKENTEPIAWVRERKVGEKTQRVFYTSLGHPKDFEEEAFTRMLRNAIGWCSQDGRLK